MNIENVMKNMDLSESEKEYIRNNHFDLIVDKIKSIWQVIEDAGRYG